MRITDLLKSESIALGQKPADKQSAIRQLADLMAASGNLSDKEQYLKDVFAREASARQEHWRQGSRHRRYDGA